MEEVLTNLNKTIGGIKGRTDAGLMEAGLTVQRVSQERIPVDTGNAKASAYTRKASGGVEVGYTAAYATFIHENMEQKLKGQPRSGGSGKGVYWSTGRPKFLESALVDVDIVGIVGRRAKV